MNPKTWYKKTKFLVQAAIIAAIYVILVIIWPLSSSAIQVRLAESLTVLPFFTTAAIPGVTIGCLIANIVTGAALFDVIFGTLATFLGTVGSFFVRRNKYLIPLPPIFFNTLIIPWVLKTAYGLKDAVPYLMLTVGIGEIISCGILGIILLTSLQKYGTRLFHE